MMLDLNLVAVPAESSTTTTGKKKGIELSNSPMESSGSFNSSSVVNADGCGDEDSCSNGDVFAYNFAILSNGKTLDDDDDDVTGDRTIQLFPVECGANTTGRSQSSSSVSTVQMQWLDLGGCRDYVGPVKQSIEAQEQHQKPPPQQQQQQQVKKSRRGPRSRSSQYRGVTFYRRTGRWESHIWDCGKQVYLGGFDTAHAAARAYDRAAIKFRGVDADINFNVSDYEEDIKQMSNFTKEEFVHILRRQSTGFSRGSSKYRGVTLHKCGRWEARMGQFLGKKAYDKAALKCNGREAVTNFEPSTYDGEMPSETHFGDGIQNLDLNLGIAPPDASDGLKVNSSVTGLYFQNGWDGRSIDRGQRILNSVSTTMKNQLPSGHSMASEHPSQWDDVNSRNFPIYEERAMGKRNEVDSLPNWTRQIQGPYGGGPNLLPLFSTAASSGFASSTIMTPSAAAGQTHFPSSTILYHHFSPSITNPSNVSHLYYRS